MTFDDFIAALKPLGFPVDDEGYLVTLKEDFKNMDTSGNETVDNSEWEAYFTEDPDE